jgi:uncharacterized protein (TIGR03086 family)
MSQQHIDLWKQAADAFDQRYQAVTEEQWASPTPCDDWAVKELVDHAVGTQVGFAGPVIGVELEEGAEWPAIRDAMTAAISAEGALEGMVDHPAFGQVPKSMILGIGTSDLLLHAWDLARAIGADETLPAEVVQACHMGLQQFPPEMMRSPGFFGPEVECAADADAQTKMLSFAGRQV